MDKCPCENCILYAMCRSRLIDMSVSYTRIAFLSNTCQLLSDYIYKDIHDQEERSKKTTYTWKIFDIDRWNLKKELN